MPLLYKKVIYPIVVTLTREDPEVAHHWMVFLCRFPQFLMVFTSGRLLLLLGGLEAAMFYLVFGVCLP